MTRLNKSASCLFFLLFIVSLGCSPKAPGDFLRTTPRSRSCTALFKQLDKAVSKNKLRNAYAREIKGFPYLRTNRILEGFEKEAHSGVQKALLVQWMKELAEYTRQTEIKTLPPETLDAIPLPFDEPVTRQNLRKAVRQCSDQLFRADTTVPDFYSTALELSHTPDEYSLFLRTIGLYPLLSMPVTYFSYLAYEDIRSMYEIPLEELEVHGRLTSYVPEEKNSYGRGDILSLLYFSKLNPLHISRLSEEETRYLATVFAPVIIQDVAADHDRIGHPFWKGDTLSVNTDRPAVFYYVSHVQYRLRPVLQINYVFWYQARKGENAPWIEHGKIDGITVRVTINSLGKVVMVDGMNNCGCYHHFIPRRDEVVSPIPQPFQVDPLTPQYLPDAYPDKPLGVRIMSDWHQVQRYITMDAPLSGTTYELLPYETLETLNYKGFAKSMFNENGIAFGSQRIEPYLLFSMGVPEVGAMRQRDHHPLELVGRIHFHDPDVLDRNFRFR